MSRQFSGAVIFLHGSGDSGDGVTNWINHVDPAFLQSLHAANIKVIFPTAPMRPYSLMNGEISTVWHDRWSFGMDAVEDIEGLSGTASLLNDMIQELMTVDGLKMNKIAIGGFSMGGGTSLVTGLSMLPKGLGGIFSMSSWVSSKSNLWNILDADENSPSNHHPPIFMSHGEQDGMIKIKWGEFTRDNLISKGLKVQWLSEPNIDHEPGPKQLNVLSSWLIQTLIEGQSNSTE
mmetsp:Transcript_10401/g.12636  ORF Transcript_10401/g.12636 Transcript_10401/m.12636 type:complete len:233 (-) Transcript_10401:61-759(-)|eukprot:CAMPEP_0114335402 /NCGR_PEP_ID=MMETSP0101-20121206/5035_1 /TAXON_ID=38822 ORGANISM="Pteridomonas danica, Strain PT" /NCGR_SAMPLE_ID=MMETSP0101 /ASSEMBLY_ACC=CAM_ASM_000211 /LENGTH=232 /DNA_ID=CAMNT_0001467017 /DNA_START=33 /DNA_END=731 /DNA_ORIENTATION=-